MSFIKDFENWKLNENEVPEEAMNELYMIIEDIVKDEPTAAKFVEMFKRVFEWEVKNDVECAWDLEGMEDIYKHMREHFEEFDRLPKDSPIIAQVRNLYYQIKRMHHGQKPPKEEPKEREPRELTKKEVMALIDVALDKRDFEEVKKLSPYLQEEERIQVEERMKLLEQESDEENVRQWLRSRGPKE